MSDYSRKNGKSEREREMAREAFYENGSRVALDIDISLLANGYRTEERRLNE